MRTRKRTKVVKGDAKSKKSVKYKKHEEASESEDSSEDESMESSGEELLLDNLSDEDSSDGDWEVFPRKRKRVTGPQSPAKSTKPSAPGSAKKAKGKSKKKVVRRTLSFPLEITEDKWRTADEPDIKPAEHSFKPLRETGPQLVSTATYSPLQLFHMFFTSSSMLKVVANTNAYGEISQDKKKQPWQKISLKDFKKFLSLVIYMGLIKCFRIPDYWKKSDIYSLPYPLRVMSSRRFMSISTHVHLSHPKKDAENEKKKGTPEYDRLFKIKPLYDDIREACRSSFQPYQNISIDERMVASKARNFLKQYMKSKPTKWGFKLFVLADSLFGYTWDFFIYEGKSISNQRKGIAYDSVMSLMNEKLLGSGYRLFVDNFYTSPALFRDLHSKKINACGTLRTTRVARLKATAPRGSIRWFRDNKLLFVEWKDKRSVMMCSTFHKAYTGDKVKRKVKGNDGVWKDKEFPIPPAVLDYNNNMGGVDLSDALIGYYTVLHKTRKWYRTFFYHFVDIAIVNAFILHQHMATSKSQKPMTQKAFREALVLELADTEPHPPPPVRVCNIAKKLHLPKYISVDGTQGRRKCKLCHLKTPIKCLGCDESLCLVSSRNCFAIFHGGKDGRNDSKEDDTDDDDEDDDDGEEEEEDGEEEDEDGGEEDEDGGDEDGGDENGGNEDGGGDSTEASRDDGGADGGDHVKEEVKEEVMDEVMDEVKEEFCDMVKLEVKEEEIEVKLEPGKE